MALFAGSTQVAGEEPDLAGDQLTAAFAGATLIGTNWAEYYAPDGGIVGSVLHLGMLHDLTGR